MYIVAKKLLIFTPLTQLKKIKGEYYDKKKINKLEGGGE